MIASYLSSWLPAAGISAYAVTFYLTTYNEINYGESNSYDDSDMPYTIALVECCLCVATLIVSAAIFSRKPEKKQLFGLSLYFWLLTLAFVAFSIVRGSNLGIFGGDSSVCTDVGLTGCPTTRYEAINEAIEYLSPSGGDCQFFFWGPDMKARYTGASACNGYGETNGLCGTLIENYMDWTKASSYGWRDDPSDISSASQGHIATIDKIHNMKYLFSQQATIGNISIPAAYAYSRQPSISACWYWGCSQLCQPHRFGVNRWWFVSSVSLFVIHLICAFDVTAKWRAYGSSEPTKPAKDVEMPGESTNFAPVPEIGRRKRRLIQNPGGLQF